jgi:WD40 repeat protein
MADVFVSYSRRDAALVRRLSEGLEARGKDVWVDLNDIMPSAPWMAEIRAAIAEADSVVFVISPDSVASEVCQAELSQAVELNKRLVPIVARPTPIADVPASLAALNFLDFSSCSTEEAFEDVLAQLAGALDTDIGLVHLHTRLLLRASEWEDSGEDRARLLRGRQLADAEAWLAARSGGPAPTPAQVRLIFTSRRAALRRQRGSLAAALAVALGMVALSIVAVLQWHAAVVQRGQAQSRADAAEAEGQLQADPPRALDLALQGIKAAHTAEAQTALRDSVRVSVLRAVLPPMKAAVEAASRSADGGGGLGQVAFSPSGQYVALANTSGGVEVWHWGARSGLGSYGHPYHLALPGATQAEFMAGGRVLLVADSDGQLLEWPWKKGKPLVVRRGLQDPVLSQNGALVASVSISPTTSLISVTTAIGGQPVCAVRAHANNVAFSPDGSLLATWGAASNVPIELWFTSDGHFYERVGKAPEQLANTGEVPLAISPMDDRMAVGEGNQLSVYNLVSPAAAPKVLDMTAPGGAYAEAGGSFNAGSLAWSPSGEELAEGGYDQAIRVWAGDLGGQVFLGPVDNGAGGVAFSPNGRYLVSSSGTGMGSVWEWGADNVDYLSVPSSAPAATMSRNGNLVAYAGYSSGGGYTVDLWYWHEFRVVPLTSVGSFSGVNLAFSPNGRWLAVASQGNISVWDVAHRHRLASLPLSGHWAMADDLQFDSSGTLLAAVKVSQPAHSTNFRTQPATLFSWRWGSPSPPGRLTGLKENSTGNLAIAETKGDGSVLFVYGRDYLAWDGRSLDRATISYRRVVPAGADVFGAAFFDGGKRMITVVGPFAKQKTEVVDLRTGAVTDVLDQYTMGGEFVTNADASLVAGTAFNGDVLVWDERKADTPAVIPTSTDSSSVVLAAGVLLVDEGQGLYVVPDPYCQPLQGVLALAKSLVIEPTALSEGISYAG